MDFLPPPKKRLKHSAVTSPSPPFPPPPPLLPSTPSSSAKLRSLSCVLFFPCHSLADFLWPQTSFSPLFSHHFFGEKEEIAGYDHLSVRFYYIADTFETYVSVSSTNNTAQQQLTADATAVCPSSPCPHHHPLCAPTYSHETRS
eukprot:GHVS01032390.1.p1 GENE.GHVS01032390.1~~GHVS01032390.1.p1  ORF type:complete len:163 (+),score=74.69 GHVS01032390.1:59-490(+)